MDKSCVNIFHDLNNMQLKIASLFQELAIEKNECESNMGNLKKYLKNVMVEVNDLKRENNLLRKKNKKLEMATLHCIKLFKNLESQNRLLKDHKIILETLRETFLRIDKETEDLISNPMDTKIFMETDLTESEKSSGNTGRRVQLDEESIKKEIESISEINLTTQFFNDDDDYADDGELNKYSAKSQWTLNEQKSEKLEAKDFSERKTVLNQRGNFEQPDDLIPIKQVPSPMHINNGNSLELQGTVETLEETVLTQKGGAFTPEKDSKASVKFRSPVFKDLGNRKQERIPPEENGHETLTSPLKLLNEKFLLKTVDLIVSPLKRSSNQPDREMSSPKRSKTVSRKNSPKSPSGNQLKRSNSREAEISISGVRKLTQTFLNIECFKKRSPEPKKDTSNSENEILHDVGVTVECETKFSFDEDDDVIIESPKKSEPTLEDFAKTKKTSEEALNEAHFLSPPGMSGGGDLDETYVSSSVVRKCRIAEKHVLEPLNEERTVVKRSAIEKSPEYDSVPYIYKREAVRKRTERMKLPGHVCLECDRYYKDVFGSDVNCPKLKEMLNKCSRHRDKYSPSVDNTPPGYWKPYLTATATISLSKNDTLMR